MSFGFQTAYLLSGQSQRTADKNVTYNHVIKRYESTSTASESTTIVGRSLSRHAQAHAVARYPRIAICILFVTFLGFRVVQLVRYSKDHPAQRQPGAEELAEAAKLIVGSSGGVAHGNNAEAQNFAVRLSREMKTIRLTMLEGGDPDSIDMQLLTKGEFLVFCQLNEDSCVFLIHVPELRRYTAAAKESIAELAYVEAATLLDSARKPGVRKLALAMRGNIFYERVLIGDYSFQSKDPLTHAQRSKDEGALAPSLYRFFAPKTAQNPGATR